MQNDTAFLEALLANPQDDNLRLVYADWLEEQGEPTADARAEFLRLTVQLATPARGKGPERAPEKRQQELAATMDTEWLAVVSRLAVENCQGKRKEAESRRSYPLRFDFLCDRRWEDLQTTEDQNTRFCDACKHNVHFCDTIMDARDHARRRHCVAVDLGVIRRKGDLEPQGMTLGLVSEETLRREEERARPDPVSLERERRKRQEQHRGRDAGPPSARR